MGRSPQQLRFDLFQGLSTRTFGGTLLAKGNPRESRPISIKRPLHLVLRSSQAVAERSMLRTRHARPIERLVRRVAKARGVRVYRYANSGNHLHLLILAPSRVEYRAYIRAISGLIARQVMGTERGIGGKLATRAKRFWDARPFTRIVEWGRDFRRACGYLLQNKLEALGFIPFQPRQKNKRPSDTS